MSKSKRPFQFLFLLILAAGLILRLIRLQELFYFTFDEEVIAFVSKRMIKNYHFPLIGGVTPFHFHLGPYFYYLSAAFLFLSRLNPLGWGMFAALLSCLGIYLTYQVAKTLFNQKTALLASLFYSFSFIQIIFDRHYWPLTLNPILTLLTLLSLIKMKKNKNYCFLLAPTLIFALHTDPSNWLLFPLAILIILWQKFKVGKKLIFSFFLTLLSALPLLVFDLRHNFVNSQGILQYLQEQKAGFGFSLGKLVSIFLFLPKALSETLYSFFGSEISHLLTSCQPIAQERIASQPFLIVILTAFIMIFPFFSTPRKPWAFNPKNIFFQFNFLFLLFLVVGLNIFGNLFDGPIFEHYLAGLFPLFYLNLAFFLSFFSKSAFKFLLPVFLLSFLFANLNLSVRARNDFGLDNKLEAVKWTKTQLDNKDFALDSLSSCFRYDGFRYLFYLEKNEPVLSFVDPQLFWLYDQKTPAGYPQTLVVFVSHDFKKESGEYNLYQQYQQNLIKNKTFGKLEVLILNNENEDYKISY